eukprot:scaffold3124_cov390-Prasinococcus_capsulatus_cf.AAC.6
MQHHQSPTKQRYEDKPFGGAPAASRTTSHGARRPGRRPCRVEVHTMHAVRLHVARRARVGPCSRRAGVAVAPRWHSAGARCDRAPLKARYGARARPLVLEPRSASRCSCPC